MTPLEIGVGLAFVALIVGGGIRQARKEKHRAARKDEALGRSELDTGKSESGSTRYRDIEAAQEGWTSPVAQRVQPVLVAAPLGALVAERRRTMSIASLLDQADIVQPSGAIALELARPEVLKDFRLGSSAEIPADAEFVAIAVMEHLADGDSGKTGDPTFPARTTATFHIERVVSTRPGLSPMSLAAQVRPNGKFPVRVHEPDCWETGQGKAGKLGTEFSAEILRGHAVLLVCRGWDPNDRALCDVYFRVKLPGVASTVSADYARAIIRVGRAIVYRGSQRPQGNPELAPLEAAAVSEKRGVWGLPGDYQLPHEWRSQKRGEHGQQVARKKRRRVRTDY